MMRPMTKILNYGWLGILAAGETVQLSRKDLLAAPREYHTTRVLFCMKKLKGVTSFYERDVSISTR